jgi:hypothetical protein
VYEVRTEWLYFMLFKPKMLFFRPIVAIQE